MEEKLVRSLANNKWFDLFSTTMVHNEDASTSDHTAVNLELSSRKCGSYRKFRFENSWIKETDCRDIVAHGWERARGGGGGGGGGCRACAHRRDNSFLSEESEQFKGKSRFGHRSVCYKSEMGTKQPSSPTRNLLEAEIETALA